VRSYPLVLVTAAALAFGAAACSSDPEAGDTGTSGDSIAVTLKDFAIAPAMTTAPSGTVSFDISNDGPSVHEFEVLATDTAPDALPVDSGVAQTQASEIVDEVENIAPGTSAALSVDLDPGSYVIICNVVDHYEAGMHVGFTVT
jgi:uncharacterized cupredoxin-like copper-binding protein